MGSINGVRWSDNSENKLSIWQKAMRQAKLVAAWTGLIAMQLVAWCGWSGSTTTTPDVVDTVAPATATLTATPASTTSNSTSVEVNGEIWSTIFVNWVSTNTVIWATWKAVITLDTTATLWTTLNFAIVLKDASWNASNPLNLSVDRLPEFSLESNLITTDMIKEAIVNTTSFRFVQLPVTTNFTTELPPEQVNLNIEVTRQVLGDGNVPSIFGANVTLADIISGSVYWVTAVRNWNTYAITLDPENMTYNLMNQFMWNDTPTIPNHMIITFRSNLSTDQVLTIKSGWFEKFFDEFWNPIN